MSRAIKNQKSILSKLGISQLNPMQEEAKLAIHSSPDVVLVSPTGTGKTFAFLLPVVAELNPACAEVQALVLVPSRELAIQIEQVTREMGSGYKTNVVYGGRPISKDKMDLRHRPAILIGTPGRVADHIRRSTFTTEDINYLVFDEFDKSLEVGFEKEMQEIVEALPNIKKRILTSATNEVEIPKFVGLNESPININYSEDDTSKLNIKRVISPTKDKLNTLVNLLCHLGTQPGIIFCNFKDSIQRVSQFLTDNHINHGCFHGDMDQKERERSLIKFRNGSHRLIVATDLAARGIDIPEIKFIIHYHLPMRSHEFTHRNGRTARMHSDGTAYIIQWEQEQLPDFIDTPDTEEVLPALNPPDPHWKTLFISGGRRDKISKGDITGIFCKQGKLKRDQIGVIELKQDCAFVAVASSKVKQAIKLVDNTKLKKKKVRVTEI